MSTFDQAIESYKKTFSDKLNRTDYDVELLHAIAKSLGPAIYNRDSAKVACSEKKELDHIKSSFLIDKLGLDEKEDLDIAIKGVCATMGSSNRNKYRVVFYYLLVEKFNKQSLFIKKEKMEPKEEKMVEEDLGSNSSHSHAAEETSEEIISNYALYAAGAGLIPIPIIDLVSISTIQYKMIKRLARNYAHVTFDENKTKSVIAAIVGGVGTLELGILARLLFKGIPFFGPIVGGTAISGFAYFSTKLIGHIFDDHFASGGDLSIEELTLKRMKDTFRSKMKSGKATN